MAILVTGGAGYIGAHVCVELLAAGYEVVVIDNYSNSREEVLRRIERIAGKPLIAYRVDLLDRPAVEAVFEEHSIEAVIHLAGLKSVGESVAMPIAYYHNNITGTLILCDVMRGRGIKRFVFSSSATVYGVPERIPITEDMPLSATNPYGQTKLMLEQVLRDIHGSDPQWSIALLRYFNPIGAHESGTIGEDPKGIPNNLMPYITQVAVGRRAELQVYGDDYETVDGTGVRDYIHVVDLARGHLAALRYVMEASGVEAFNLGTGRGYSVLELVSAFEKASGVRVPYRIVDRRPGDVAACYADSSKAEEALGWRAEKGIDDMCRDSWRWQSQNPNGYEG
ncbi:UDP-glucose 4-epimerase GalE [Paenibacillus antri]|uniref:UDP-glucose 4-epimerase n=1 Tax=Paenibacillus antri TaxID=2582848 RepID=A0A5R9G6H3_9BACL|nr:UDP-glucose 4-epimerase GalE [Paenibacillus antri]TLS51992.1 UDP-glucose 4-epimerase GalE [Paenibacillus antri]